MALLSKARFILKNPSFPWKLLLLRKRLAELRKKRIQRWIFQCDYEGHFPYLKPYFVYSKKYPDVEIFFFQGKTNEKNPLNFLISQGVSSKNILDFFDLVRLTEWDLYISPTEWGNVFPGNSDALRIQVFHTLADKGLEYGQELTKFNIIFANGPVHHEFLDRYVFQPFPEARNKCEVINAGYAKIDDLFDGTYDRLAVRKQLAIPENDKRPIVLYAPNWEVGSALRTYGEPLFHKFTELSEHIFVIKLHYMSLLSTEWDLATGGVDWHPILRKYGQYDNIRVTYEQNINPFMVAADIMLTDYGGASLEFLALNKPIIYLDCPHFFEERGHDIFEKGARETGFIISDISQLAEAVDKSFCDSAAHLEKRKDTAQRLLYNPGKATQTGFEALYNHVLMKQRKSQE